MGKTNYHEFDTYPKTGTYQAVTEHYAVAYFEHRWFVNHAGWFLIDIATGKPQQPVWSTLDHARAYAEGREAADYSSAAKPSEKTP